MGKDSITLKFGERVLRDCFVGVDGEKVRLAGEASYKRLEASGGEECLGMGDLRATLRN